MTERELPARARSVLGLYQMGWRDPQKIANVIFNSRRESPTKKQVNYVRGILLSRDQRVIRARIYGIKGQGASFINRPIRCPICRNKVSYVPCVSCYIASDTPIKPKASRRQEYRAITPRRSTKAEAGSDYKMTVMRRRVARGDSPFHPNDPMYRGDPEESPVREVALSDLSAALRESRR